jgi:hypothetical protein
MVQLFSNKKGDCKHLIFNCQIMNLKLGDRVIYLAAENASRRAASFLRSPSDTML